MTDKYKISEEIIELFDRLQVAEGCRNECITNIFGWKRASHFGLEAVKWKRKAFDAIYAIYPELSGESLTYSYGDDHISIKADPALQQQGSK